MRKILLLIFLLLAILFISISVYLHNPVLKTDRTVYLMVNPGDGLGKILERADSLNLSLSPLAAKLYMRIYGADKKIVPGRYTVKASHSRLDLLQRLRNGDIDYIWITIPEGLTLNHIIEIASQKSGRSSLDFLRLAHDSAWLSSLTYSPPDLEGYLFPESYKLPYFSSAEFIYKTMLGELESFLDSTKISRMREIGFSVHQLLTFASLIESETADREEMSVISSVYHNRLDRGMLLQCDPTVIYALGGLDRPLLLKDLKYDSPYNTYRYKGLPPGPINSPGRDALTAALYPDTTDYLFFVADLNGRHIFSRTNAEHERARETIKSKRRALKNQN